MKIGRCIDVGWAFNMGCHGCEELWIGLKYHFLQFVMGW